MKPTKLQKHIRQAGTLPGGILSGVASAATMRRYARAGWVRYVGRWVLTVEGFKA